MRQFHFLLLPCPLFCIHLPLRTLLIPQVLRLLKCLSPLICLLGHTMLWGSGPQPFWQQGLVLWKTVFPWTGVRGMVWRGFKHSTFISVVITSASSDHQGLYPGGWGPLLWGHGLCLVCCLLCHPTHAAFSKHVNHWNESES